LSNTWLTVSHDLGDSLDVHFRNKRPLGERMAKQMLQHSYGFNLSADSPKPQRITTEGNLLFVDFQTDDVCLFNGNPLFGFEVAGRDSVFYPATGSLEGGMVSLSSPQVNVPVYVRYAWQPFTKANLIGKGGMPVSTFSEKASLIVEPLTGFPRDEKGIEQGVSACFAGTIGNCLIMAGGCNYPDVPAAQGGKKKYYRGIYMAHLDGGNHLNWQRIGNLPVAVGYGVSISVPDGIICIGGNNEKTSLKSVFKIRLNGKKAVVESLPALPEPLDNFTGALCGDSIVVFGNNKVYALCLSSMVDGWKLVKQIDVVRQQPVSGFVDGDFCVWGGFSPMHADVPATLSLDGLRFHDNEVSSLASPFDGETVFLGGATATNMNAQTVVAMGGVNKDIFLKALNNPADDYLTWSPDRYRFNGKVFMFTSHGWKYVGENHHLRRAGATLVKYGESLYLIGGELKPGIRTPSVCRIEMIH
jgi:sialate O-acetylesterase